MSEIKAMETLYKGFRFRSRLEARWAMFFELAGVTWEFEPQPMLVNGGPYLPDFFVKDGHRSFYHEVKPVHDAARIKPTRVYLGGKMSTAHDWRGQSIFVGEGDSWSCVDVVMHAAAFKCTGPFPTVGGHHDVEQYGEDAHFSDARRQDVVRLCKASISDAELFCAHLSTADAYGTLVEIGFAAAHGKRISLSVYMSLLVGNRRGQDNHDLWFAAEMSRDFAIVSGFKEAQAHHAGVIHSMSSREYQLIGGLGHSTAAVMTFGDPLEVARSRTELSFRGGGLGGLCRNYIKAAEAVRAHRFDRH